MTLKPDGAGGDLDLSTIAAQAGARARVGDTVSTVPPINASTTFTAASINDVHAALVPDSGGFAYSRNANPTVAALEYALALLEGTEDAAAFSSGMAAIHTALLALALGPGDIIVAASSIYGVTRSLFAQLLEFGIETRFVDIFDLQHVKAACAEPDVRALYFESIANPLLHVADIEALTGIARQHRLTTILDNTFATPYLVRPHGLGVDLVVHSATKYIAGHGDVTAGVVAGKQSWIARIKQRRTVNGAILSPFEAWLTLRGLRTLPLRVERQCASAFEIARWLGTRPWVERVYYPGLPESRFRPVAARQFGERYGGVVAFDLSAGREETLRFIDALRLIVPGTSLGDVISLVLYPPLSSHRALDAEQLAASGIRPGLVRLSVGLESARDLIADLDGAAKNADLTEIGAADIVLRE